MFWTSTRICALAYGVFAYPEKIYICGLHFPLGISLGSFMNPKYPRLIKKKKRQAKFIYVHNTNVYKLSFTVKGQNLRCMESYQTFASHFGIGIGTLWKLTESRFQNASKIFFSKTRWKLTILFWNQASVL